MLTCLFLSQTVCFCPTQSVSVTDSFCPPEVTERLCLSETAWVCHKQPVSVTDSLCPSQTVFNIQRKVMSVTENLYLSLTLCFFHGKSVSVNYSLCLSQTGCVCHRQTVLVSVQTFFLIIFGLVFTIIFTINTRLLSRFVCEIWVWQEIKTLNVLFLDPCPFPTSYFRFLIKPSVQFKLKDWFLLYSVQYSTVYSLHYIYKAHIL